MAEAFEHHYAEVEGVRLHWAATGPRTPQPTLVLLHGIADSHLSFHPVAEHLACDRRVLMPDLPGCGLSGRPDASYALNWVAHIVARWLELLGEPKVDIVGHSYGGGVLQMLLLECPERIRRGVLVDAGGLGRGVGFWLRLGSLPRVVERWGQPFMAFGTRRSLGSTEGGARSPDVTELARMNSLPGTARAFSRMVRDVIDWRGQTRMFYQRAKEIRAFPPLAVFWGEDDKLIPVAQGRAFAAQMRGVRFHAFPRAGHYVHRDAPTAFVAALRAFLAAEEAAPAVLQAGE
jgi:pimeloyl-ACP methyl ester carboxylesterase